jgi:DNA invertase Pin-like site-specific DNA recombinase
MNAKPLIGYYRVSTTGQGDSGLGLEAQRETVRRYAEASGATIKKDFTEIESGTLSVRPQLMKALEYARGVKGVLCIAKLDRLYRNVAALSALMEGGVDFVACDNPTAGRLTIHILAAVAEDEARRISERTKAALAAKRARGEPMGSALPNHWKGIEDRRLAGAIAGSKASAIARRKKALAGIAYVLREIQQMRKDNLSFRDIAARLNADGHRSPRGGNWLPTTVRNALKIAGELKIADAAKAA